MTGMTRCNEHTPSGRVVCLLGKDVWRERTERQGSQGRGRVATQEMQRPCWLVWLADGRCGAAGISGCLDWEEKGKASNSADWLVACLVALLVTGLVACWQPTNQPTKQLSNQQSANRPANSANQDRNERTCALAKRLIKRSEHTHAQSLA